MLVKFSIAFTLLVGFAVAGCSTQQQPLRSLSEPFSGELGLDIVPLDKIAATGAVPVGEEAAVLKRELCSSLTCFSLVPM